MSSIKYNCVIISLQFNRLHRSYEGLKSKRTQSGKRSETTSTQVHTVYCAIALFCEVQKPIIFPGLDISLL